MKDSLSIILKHSSISYVDALIGNLVAKLDELRLADDTIIILCGDYGYRLLFENTTDLKFDIKVYPSPSNEELYVFIDTKPSHFNNNYTFILFNLNGKTIHTEKIEPGTSLSNLYSQGYVFKVYEIRRDNQRIHRGKTLIR